MFVALPVTIIIEKAIVQTLDLLMGGAVRKSIASNFVCKHKETQLKLT